MSFADNKIYRDHKRYTLSVIGQKEDEVMNIANQLIDLFEYCRIDRLYVADTLNHVVLTLYY